MQTVQPTVAYQARNSDRKSSSGQSPTITLEQRIDRVDSAVQQELMSKSLAVPATLSIKAVRTKVRNDLFKSLLVAVVAMIIASELRFVSLESAGIYLFGVAFTSYLSLHSLDHCNQAKNFSPNRP